MTLRIQKVISALLIAVVVIGGFEALIYILNLNQPGIYLQTAFWIWLYLMFKIAFLYDLHFKKPGAFLRARQKHKDVAHVFIRQLKVLGSAALERLRHLRSWEALKQWLHFLLLPGFIFWASVSLFFVNLGNLKIQEIIAGFSGVAIILDYWFLKEAFSRGGEAVDTDIFVALSMVKIYAAAALYAAALSILRYYCLDPAYFALEVFSFSFLLIYQALYLHRKITGGNTLVSLAIAAAMGVAGYLVYIFWGYNYFTAAVFLAALYNSMWGTFHYHLDQSLTWRAFWEILIISAIVAGMVFSVTNFKARISNGCDYYLTF